jgi:hypothetical protein
MEVPMRAAAVVPGLLVLLPPAVRPVLAAHP